jgi:hypothetical protein
MVTKVLANPSDTKSTANSRIVIKIVVLFMAFSLKSRKKVKGERIKDKG